MRSPEFHLEQIRKMFPATDRAVVTVPLTRAAGLVAAEDIAAVHDSPRFDNSQMDGYALSVDQVAAAPGTFRVGPTIPAGTDPDAVYPRGVKDAIAPVMTGAKLPHGTAGIVAVESCTPGKFPEDGTFVEVPDVEQDQFIRRAGADTAAGTTLIAAGTRLDAAAIAALAGQSITEVAVHPPARLLVCTGGAEIGSPEAPGATTGETAGAAATIPDSNSPMLRVLAERYGMEIVAVVPTDDDPVAVERDLTAAVAEHEPTAIITSGGISHGKFEVVRQVLSAGGWFGHVDQQPGGPQGLSRLNGVPAICLPGNPVSTLVSFRLFVAPVLGHAPEPVTAVLAEDRQGLRGHREQFLRGRIRVDDDGILRVRGVGGSGSHLIAQAIGANALVRIPAEAVLTAGETVTVYPL